MEAYRGTDPEELDSYNRAVLVCQESARTLRCKSSVYRMGLELALWLAIDHTERNAG